MNIILGSSSIYRKKVLEEAGFTFETMSPDIDEKAIRTDDFYQLPLLIARAKMAALVSKISTPSLVITADQVVVCDGKLFEKPQSDDEVRSFFESYGAGHPAETVSAVVVTNTETGKSFEGVDTAKTFFNPVPPDVLDAYIKTGVPFINAGAFAHEDELLKPFIQKIEGTTDSVMGLPLSLLKELLRKAE